MNGLPSGSGTTSIAPRARLKEIGGFELLSRIGEGAMGAVFKARQKSLDRVVALKILPPSIAQNHEFITRFMKEARATAKLNHPNIVSAIDAGQDSASGLWYFAMEYVDGPSLKQLIDEQEVLEEKRALEIITCVARALECAARVGLVHRDVKPHNILLNSKGLAKLADLGLAHEVDGEGLNEGGRVVGTPCYMSPEQARGELDALDIRTDLYALGATLFHMLTGRPPYTGKTTAEIMAKHLYDPIPQASKYNRKVSLECSRLINSLMQKEKERRLQSPALVLEAIERIQHRAQSAAPTTTGAQRRVGVTGGTTTARPILRGPEGRRRSRSQGTNYAGLLLAAVVLFGGGFVYWYSQQPIRLPEPVPEVRTQATTPDLESRKPVVEQKQAQSVAADPVALRWKRAQLYAEKNPTDHAEIQRIYQVVLKQAAGSPLEKEIAAALKSVEARRKTAVDALWPKVEERVAEATKASDFDGALKVLDALSAEERRLLHAQIDERVLSIGKEAEERIQPILAKADELMLVGDPAAAQAEMDKLAEVRFEPLRQTVSDLRTRIEKGRATVEQQALERRFGDLLARFDQAVMETEDGEAAAEVVSEARKTPEFERFGAKVNALQELALAWKQVCRQETEAQQKLRGAMVKIGKEQGVVEKVEDGVVHFRVSLEGGKIVVVRKIPAAQLPDEVRQEILKNVRLDSPAEKVAGALRHLVKGHESYSGAKKLLNEATQFPLTPHYLELVFLRQNGGAGQAPLAAPMR